MENLALSDIQGNILRGYKLEHVRHYAIQFGSVFGASQFMAAIHTQGKVQCPQVTTAATWAATPEYCFNIGITIDGLKALGVDNSVMKLFSDAFRRGPTHSAAAMGDSGESAPAHWILGGTDSVPVHALLSLYVNDVSVRAKQDALLRALFGEQAITLVFERDGSAFPDNRVHFNYKDSIAQPRVKGAPGKQPEDMQPLAEPGEFLLGKGYVNQFHGNFIGDLPAQLADNGTFGAFRILEQNVFEFEAYLEKAGSSFGMSKELVAAKLMGRWRNGDPLVLVPDSSPDAATLSEEQQNQFDYVPTKESPVYYDDSEGLRCPVGAHIRRMNPRNSLVMGKPHTRRLIRRNFPYGPPIVGNELPGRDEPERGLIGFFICGDLEMQFEFLQKTWANTDIATSGINGTTDPIIGAQKPEGGQFVIRTNDRYDPVVLADLPRLVVTKGSLYCFIPSITGISYLAELSASVELGSA
jgi:deferrochelatase/peroxidase EfeB